MKLFLEKLLDILEALLRFRRRRNGKTEKDYQPAEKKRDRQEKRKKSMT